MSRKKKDVSGRVKFCTFIIQSTKMLQTKAASEDLDIKYASLRAIASGRQNMSEKDAERLHKLLHDLNINLFKSREYSKAKDIIDRFI